MRRQEFIKIHSPSPYECLDYETTEWLKALRTMWGNWKSTKKFSDMLYNFFSSSEDPFKSALTIMVSCGDFYTGKHKSLAFEIMMHFSKWLTMEKHLDVPKSIKLDAVKLTLRQRNADLLKLVIQTFKAKEDKEMFLDFVKDLSKNKNYKEACLLASLIGLHQHFDIQEFLLPLIFLNKYCQIEMFLNGSEKHQHELAVFLDNIIGKRDVTNECLFIAQNLGVADINLSLLKYKSLSKLLMKLVRTYKLPPTICPNLNRRKSNGVLNFLLHKRYVEKGISGDSWNEMIMEAIGDDEDLHVKLVQDMVMYRDAKGALFWAKKLNVPSKCWPMTLVNYSEKCEEESDKPVEATLMENWDAEEEATPGERENFHKFPLEESHINVVDTVQGFNDFLADITNGVSIIGFDTEWKPSFGVQQTVLSLIQVAALHRVYILDMITLGPVVPQSLWAQFASFFLENPDVLKIGFDMRTDLILLKEAFRKLHCLRTTSEVGFLDLAVLWQNLVRKHKFEFPFPMVQDNCSNLSRLIELCFGESLDKSDQLSNWENRPLRKSQILYAAIDAYCLLEAYDVLVRESKSQKIPISEVIERIMYGIPMKKTRRKSRNQQQKDAYRK